MKHAKIYCVIVTYNGMRWIKKCLDSVMASHTILHTIVVDNGSTDETVMFINQHYPTVKVIETKKNLGFGQGNNVGIKLAMENNADHVFLLNQDAYIEENSVTTLVKHQVNEPAYGLLSPVHLNGKGDKLDDYFLFYLKKSGIVNLLQAAIQQKPIEKIVATDFVNAAAWLLSRECILKTGGFDPIFFHYGEDDNYAQRVMYKGFRSGICLDAIIYHDKEEKVSTANNNIQKTIKRDWIIFLNQVCDINNNNYKTLLVKRFIRYSVLLLPSLATFNKQQLIYNFSFATKIPLVYTAVKKSRNISKRKDITPHL
jgi:GT2 family glycosyltransferase